MLYISKKAKNAYRDRFDRKYVKDTNSAEKKEVIESVVIDNVIEPEKIEPQFVYVEKKQKTKKSGEKNNKENEGENGRE